MVLPVVGFFYGAMMKDYNYWAELSEKRNNDPEYIKDLNRRKNIGKKERNLKRRGISAGASGSCTKEQIESRFNYYGNNCVYCGTAENLTIEHRIPLCRGGSNWPSNIVPACMKCNLKKGKKTELEYLSHLIYIDSPSTPSPLMPLEFLDRTLPHYTSSQLQLTIKVCLG